MSAHLREAVVGAVAAAVVAAVAVAAGRLAAASAVIISRTCKKKPLPKGIKQKKQNKRYSLSQYSAAGNLALMTS